VVQSGDGGASISYSKPPFYALYLAPFVRLSPRHGPFVANALLLALAAVVAARALRPLLGPSAPLAVAAWVFGSVAFASVFWAHPDLFFMCLAAIALALAFGGVRAARELGIGESPGGGPAPGDDAGGALAAAGAAWPWAVAGVLIALVTASRPVYGVLLVPLALAVPRRRRGRDLAALLLGGALVAGVALAAQQAATGTWTSYGAQRRGFYERTGYPDVDFAPAQWPAKLEELGASRWTGSGEVSRGLEFLPALWRWNTLYTLAGRHVGLLPYFLPLLLGFAGRPRGAARWALVAAVGVALAGLLLIRPFNFWGGGAALANRYFLPLYPALWFLGTRPLRSRWPLAAGLAAAPFLWPLWLAPASYPRSDDGGYRFVGAAARRLLPYETTQNQLKPSGHEDFLHQGLWMKSLDPALGPTADGQALALVPGRDATLLLGSPTPLDGLEVLPRGLGEARLAVDGLTVPAAVSPARPGSPARRRLAVPLGSPRAVHPMWWTREPFHLYEVRLRLDGAAGPVTLSLRPLPRDGGG
jgi:hypothetical protein